MKINIKSKFVIILFLILLFIMTQKVFATDYEIISYTDRFEKQRQIINYPIDKSYGYIIRDGYMFVLENANSYFFMNDDTSLYVSGSCKCLVLYNNNTSLTRVGQQGSGRFAVLKEVFYTSANIYKGSSKDGIALAGSTDFFQMPPEGVLLEEMSKVEMKTTLAEILGLLPVIVSVLAFLLALRKGLRMLSTFLRKS